LTLAEIFGGLISLITSDCLTMRTVKLINGREERNIWRSGVGVLEIVKEKLGVFPEQ